MARPRHSQEISLKNAPDLRQKITRYLKRSIEYTEPSTQDTTIRLIFARNLAIARERAGLSQQDICDHTGFSQPYYSDCERGLINIGTDNLAKLSVALGIFPHNLLNPTWPKGLASSQKTRPRDTDMLVRIHGPNIRDARVRAGFSQRALCKLTGIGQSYLSQVETGTWNMGLDNLSKVARALGVRPHDLLDPAGIPHE